MKSVLLLLALTAMGWTQEAPPPVPSATATITERNKKVNYTDLYCAGFLGKPLPRGRFVAGGMDTPHQTRFGTGELIFLRGSDYKPGTRVSIVRPMRDPNELAPFSGQDKRLKLAGQVYGDIGYAVVLESRGQNMAVARVEFSCESILPGDLILPFVVRQPVTFRLHSTMDRFPASPSALTGQIAAARDFEQYFGAGTKVYLNIGADQGVKAGDLFRIVRGFERKDFDGADAGVFDATITEDTQKGAPRLKNKELKDLPRQVVGEAVVLSTQPGTATAMITFAVREAHVGDTVERQDIQ